MQRRISALIGDLQGLPGVERVERITRDVTAPALAPAGLPWVASGAPGTTAQEDRADLGVVRVYADSAAALIAQVASAVGQDGCELVDLHVSRASLEDVFIHLTGRALR
jgi:ABC-2 type transport system ATP-binding protein